jgi:hypothetical protein
VRQAAQAPRARRDSVGRAIGLRRTTRQILWSSIKGQRTLRRPAQSARILQARALSGSCLPKKVRPVRQVRPGRPALQVRLDRRVHKAPQARRVQQVRLVQRDRRDQLHLLSRAQRAQRVRRVRQGLWDRQVSVGRATGPRRTTQQIRWSSIKGQRTLRRQAQSALKLRARALPGSCLPKKVRPVRLAQLVYLTPGRRVRLDRPVRKVPQAREVPRVRRERLVRKGRQDLKALKVPPELPVLQAQQVPRVQQVRQVRKETRDRPERAGQRVPPEPPDQALTSVARGRQTRFIILTMW